MQSENNNIPITCEEIEPLLGGYALGEHDPDARKQIDEHLATCARCRQTLAAYTGLANMLPLSVSEAIPSPELRDRVIAAVDAAARGVARPTGPARPSARSWIGQLGWLLGGLALAVMLVWNVGLRQQLATERSNRQTAEAALAGEQSNRQAAEAALTNEQTAAQAANAALAAEKANRETLESALANEKASHDAANATLAALLQSPDVVRHILNGQSGTGQLLVDSSDQTGAIMVNGLQPLGNDRVYQLWLITDSGPVSGGTFSVDSNGRGMLLIQPSQPWTTFHTVGITMEPAGGSPGPTSPVTISGEI